MIEAVMLWNEPNNLAHWDFRFDPEWSIFASMIKEAATAIRSERNDLPIVLGGISPIDPLFIDNMRQKGVLDSVDIVAVHGFPLDWNHWTIDQWPERIDTIRQRSGKDIWVTEAGASTFGDDQLQVLALRRTARILENVVQRLHWYSLFDLPQSWEAVATGQDAMDSEYLRHFHMGLIRPDGSLKPAMRDFARFTPRVGLCQWFHFQDPRLEDGARWMKRLGVEHVRTGLNWADSVRPGADRWFDRLMTQLDRFRCCATFCFTPLTHGVAPSHTSPPRDISAFADFCGTMVRKYR